MLRPVVAKVRRCDRDLGEQLRSALSAVPLHIAEGNGSSGGNRVLRFSTALGTTDESRIALRTAVAWGYIAASEIAEGDRLRDSVGAILYKLGARRQQLVTARGSASATCGRPSGDPCTKAGQGR